MSHDFAAFGAYRLLERLGEGASGEVWKALDLRLERRVALKILKHTDEVRHRALLAEAKLASQLNHPNIATIFEAGEVEGTPFIAMGLVEGSPLHQNPPTTPSADWLRAIALQAASALHCANQGGIIHRDVKPENMVLRPDGTLKVLDFGIARAQRETGPSTAEATLVEVTRTGHAQGTPAFMSPEQVHGQPLAPASDQFSLGVTLYVLASGHHPFKRPELLDTLFAVAKESAPSLAKLRPDLPPYLVGCVERMMAKETSRRFPSMAEVILAFQNEAPTEVLPVRRPPRKPWRLLATATLIALGGVGYLGYRLRSNPSPPSRPVVAIPPLAQPGGDASPGRPGTTRADAIARPPARVPAGAG